MIYQRMNIEDELKFENSEDVDLEKVYRLRKLMSLKELEDGWEVAVEHLNRVHSKAATQTTSEFNLHKLIQKKTKLRVYRSFWIGKRCVDFFIPSICYENINYTTNNSLTSLNLLKMDNQMKGLVIEVDGKVHDIETKMNKDNRRDQALLKLGIGVLHIENEDINSTHIVNLIKSLKSMPRLSYRARKAQREMILAYTILSVLNISWVLRETN